MRAILTTTILSCVLVACDQNDGSMKSVQEMDSLMEGFSSQWISDSLGQNRFRELHHRFDSTNMTWLINELSFKGHTEEQIFKWLGKPGHRGRHKEGNGLIMSYPISQNSNGREMNLLLYFDENDKVSSIYKQEGMEKK